MKSIIRQSENRVNDAVGKLGEEATVKLACLKACTEGFVVKQYLEVRAKAAIEPADKKQKSKTSSFSSDGHVANPDLYRALRAWCNQKADDLNVDTYMILPYKVLIELTAQMPVTIPGLKKVKGFGQKKVSQFGERDSVNYY